ncbi:MAG: class I SAM-dependent methyltransferase [Rhodobacteraceae bacterium]|jgi:SAM-dependent methyltransferase|nr:class I SAM-dependent methyltransferase [Paracoccaceae bacterium]
MTIDPQTIAIYNEKTNEYAAMTEGVPHDLVRFHDYLPSGARILDYGCGPGTSAAYLTKQGHIADAFDASEKMVAYAQKHSGVTAWQATFDQFNAQNIYDGIWASFSLLHAAREDIPTFLQNIHAAIRSGGVFYIAMKLGSGRHRDDLQRLYTYVSEAELQSWLSDAGFDWIGHTTDETPGLDGSMSAWIGVFARART